MSYILEKSWVTKAGYPAMCLFVGDSHRCGYVGIPEGHPLYKVDYQGHSDALKSLWDKAQDGEIGKRSIIALIVASCSSDHLQPDCVFDVHGGITYSSMGDDKPMLSDKWWYGFDCAHLGDATKHNILPGGVERSQEYVENECEKLAAQLKEVEDAINEVTK